MTRDEAVQLARDVVRLNGEQSPGEGHVATDLARALLAAHEELERMAKVVEAAKEWSRLWATPHRAVNRMAATEALHGAVAALAASGEESP